MNNVRRLYERMIVSTLLYGSERLTHYRYNQSRVRVVEINFLRRVCDIRKFAC